MAYRRPMSTNPNEAVSDNNMMYDSSSSKQQQQSTASSNNPPPLASKPHAFRGAVLSPDHARNLTPDKALQLASALSAQASAAAQTKGVLPPGESVNLFQGCDMVELLAGISIGSSSSSSSNVNNNSNSVFRNTAPPSPKSPGANPQHARIINLLHQGGSSSSGGLEAKRSRPEPPEKKKEQRYLTAGRARPVAVAIAAGAGMGRATRAASERPGRRDTPAAATPAPARCGV